MNKPSLGVHEPLTDHTEEGVRSSTPAGGMRPEDHQLVWTKTLLPVPSLKILAARVRKEQDQQYSKPGSEDKAAFGRQRRHEEPFLG